MVGLQTISGGRTDRKKLSKKLNLATMNKLRLSKTNASKAPYAALLLSVILIFISFNSTASENAKTKQDGSKSQPFELNWGDLIPDGYSHDDLVKKYEKDIERLQTLPDGSPEGLAIIQKIQAELDNIPSNPKWDGKWIKLPGFIAPLNTKDKKIIKFLLVPYFGACIHVPPPPINQTIMVNPQKGVGIPLGQVDYPFMITGKLSLDKAETSIGNAGYSINQATFEVHHDSGWMEEE